MLILTKNSTLNQKIKIWMRDYFLPEPFSFNIIYRVFSLPFLLFLEKLIEKFYSLNSIGSLV